MITALRSIQQTEASGLMLVPRLAAGLPLLVAGAAHYIAPSLLQTTLAEAGTPLQGWLSQVLPAVAIVSGLLLLLGYFGRVAAFFGVQVSLLSLFTLVKLYEVSWLTASTQSWLAQSVLPLTVITGSFLVLWLGSGAWSLDHEDYQTTFTDADDLYTEFAIVEATTAPDLEHSCTAELLAV